MAKDNILTKKVGGVSLVDSSLIALSKGLAVDGIISPALSQVTGGNPLINGVAKVLVGGMVGGFAKGKIAQIVSASLIISAGDDVIGSFMGKKSQGQGGAVNQSATTATDDSFGQSNKTPSQEAFI